jgi:hypothetical protein
LIPPRLYFALFVDHMGQFLILFETVASRRWGQAVDEREVKAIPPPLPVSTFMEGMDELSEKADQAAV